MFGFFVGNLWQSSDMIGNLRQLLRIFGGLRQSSERIGKRWRIAKNSLINKIILALLELSLFLFGKNLLSR